MGKPTIYEVTDDASRRLAKLLAVSFSAGLAVSADFHAAGRRSSVVDGNNPEISAPK